MKGKFALTHIYLVGIWAYLVQRLRGLELEQ